MANQFINAFEIGDGAGSPPELEPLPTPALRARRAASFGLLEMARGPQGRVAERARRLTREYIAFYTHPAPFSRDGLAALWEHCEKATSNSDACLLGRSEAQRVLGRLERAPAEKPGEERGA